MCPLQKQGEMHPLFCLYPSLLHSSLRAYTAIKKGSSLTHNLKQRDDEIIKNPISHFSIGIVLFRHAGPK